MNRTEKIKALMEWLNELESLDIQSFIEEEMLPMLSDPQLDILQAVSQRQPK